MARYYKISGFDVADASYMEISELVFYSGASKLTPSSITATPTQSGATSCLYDDLFNNDAVNWAKADVASLYIVVDHGASVSPSRILIGCYSNTARAPSQLTVYSSDTNNGSDWVSVKSLTGLTYSANSGNYQFLYDITTAPVIQNIASMTSLICNNAQLHARNL